MSGDNYHRGVREQYENFPYPPREPKDELQRLRMTSLDQLPLVNHYCFGGRGEFTEMNVLVAGGGTGDATIYLAEQLKHTRSSITYLDISQASMKVARKRAKQRNLRNIKWVHGSLLDLPSVAPGPFDYINCTGVLHHLEDPAAGLLALKSVLAEHGAMGLMVYAKYGRTGIYQVQELMRLVNQDEPDFGEHIRNTRSVLSSLPPSNWFKRGAELATDHLSFGDAGIYDLFLHAQDRAYSIPELHEWLGSCGLRFTCFTFENVRYQPRQYIRDTRLLKKISALPEVDQQAIAELVSGDIIKHTFYCAPGERQPPQITDGEMVPFLWGGRVSHREAYRKLMEAPRAPLEFDSLYLTIAYRPATHSALVFKYMDGENTVAEIVQRVAAESDTSDRQAILEEIQAIYAALNPLNLMFLRHRSVESFGPEPGNAENPTP
jgi:SAM-dependent methyltransferase